MLFLLFRFIELRETERQRKGNNREQQGEKRRKEEHKKIKKSKIKKMKNLFQNFLLIWISDTITRWFIDRIFFLEKNTGSVQNSIVLCELG